MVTVHNKTVIDTTAEFKELHENWQEYLETAEEYSAWLEQYGETAWTDQVRGDSLGVETALDRLVESHDDMREERRQVNHMIDESSLRGHTSYPFLNDEAEDRFEKRYGERPQKMEEEDPRNFYYMIASDFIEDEGVKWVVKEEDLKDLEDLTRMLETDRNSRSIHIPVQNEEIPSTRPSDEPLRPPFFDELIDAYQKTGREETYDALKHHDAHVQENYGRSAVEEVLGFRPKELVEGMDAGEEFVKAMELN